MFNEKSYFVRQRDVNDDDKKINKRKTIPRFQNEIPRLIFLFFSFITQKSIDCDIKSGDVLVWRQRRFSAFCFHFQTSCLPLTRATRTQTSESEPTEHKFWGCGYFFPRTNLVQLADISARGKSESGGTSAWGLKRLLNFMENNSESA